MAPLKLPLNFRIKVFIIIIVMPIEHMETSTTTSSMTSYSCSHFPPPKFGKLEDPINLSNM